jgi:hypothetical protein
LRPLRRCIALSWAGWLLSIGLLWWQHWMRVVHPPSVIFIFLVALTFGSALAANLLRAEIKTQYDNQMRVYESNVFSVD